MVILEIGNSIRRIRERKWKAKRTQIHKINIRSIYACRLHRALFLGTAAFLLDHFLLFSVPSLVKHVTSAVSTGNISSILFFLLWDAFIHRVLIEMEVASVSHPSLEYVFFWLRSLCTVVFSAIQYSFFSLLVDWGLKLLCFSAASSCPPIDCSGNYCCIFPLEIALFAGLRVQ